MRPVLLLQIMSHDKQIDSFLNLVTTIVFLLGRLMLGGFFIHSGYHHFRDLNMMSGYAKSKGIPAPSAAVGFTGLLLLFGGLSIIFGAYPTAGIISIIIFLVPVSFTMHNFWTMTDAMQKSVERVNFLKNMAILGASLMFLAIPQPWSCSIM